MYTYLIKFRFPACESYSTLEGSSKKEVVSNFKKLRIKPHSLADIYMVRCSCSSGHIYLSCKDFEKYIIK